MEKKEIPWYMEAETVVIIIDMGGTPASNELAIASPTKNLRKQ